LDFVFVGGPWDGQRKKVQGSPVQVFTDVSSGPMHRYRAVQLPGGGRVVIYVSDDVADNQLFSTLVEGYRGVKSRRTH